MIPDPQDEAPRVKHNRTLAEKWLAEQGIEDTEPPVYEQATIVPLNSASIPAFAYNPSIAWHDRKLWMTYRFHDYNHTNTRLGICELEEHGNATRTAVLDIPHASAEDARFFTFNGKLHLSWVESDWDGYTKPHSVVKYGVLTDDWKLESVIQPNYGNNDGKGMEKNWLFFEWKTRLCVIYQRRPEQIVLELDNAEVVQEHKCPGFSWLWGTPRGGTTPMPHPDGMLTFFHSGLDNEPPPFFRRYYVGACIMEPKPPFRVLKVSREPLLRGSISDQLSTDRRKDCEHYKGRVVFPAGAVASKEGWLLSVGVNDAACAVLHIKDLKM